MINKYFLLCAFQHFVQLNFDTEQIGSITILAGVQMKSNIPLTKSDLLITLTFGNLSHHLFWNVQICYTEYDQILDMILISIKLIFNSTVSPFYYD